MGWQAEEFGTSHEGDVGAVLADGSEPGPIYLDAGGGGNFHATTRWWVYNGSRPGVPRASDLRGACACGWRGARHYPIDWTQAGDGHPDDVDTSGPYDDWEAHIADVEALSVPLPSELQVLLEWMDEHLTALADEAPLAALKGVAALERTTGRIGRQAAFGARGDEESWEEIGTGLGLTAKDARSLITRYSLRL
ncbi:hypothetical protein ACIBK8_25550 [Streptomyces sp. NPDC050161]|uniref:hypothetical protein n=1 Tax=Streptomyces sp. NPDC050161 TaxID=3365604 RepID=UPI0037A8FFCD